MRDLLQLWLWQGKEILQAEQGGTAERPPGKWLTSWLKKGSSLRMAPSEDWLGWQRSWLLGQAEEAVTLTGDG